MFTVASGSSRTSADRALFPLGELIVAAYVANRLTLLSLPPMLEVYELGRVLCYPIVSYVAVAPAAYWVLHGKMVLLYQQIAAGSEVIGGVTMQNNV